MANFREPEKRSWWRNIDVWSWIATALILLGILAEILLLFVFPHSTQQLEFYSALGANVFIGGGLLIELFCIRKGMAEKLESEERLTSALHRAINAENSLVELRQSRRSVLTVEKKVALASDLRAFRTTHFDTGVSGFDTEIVDCLWDLEEVLTAAGWHQIPWTSPAAGLTFRRNLRPECGLVSAEKVTLEMDPSSRQRLLPAAQGILDALNGVGIEAKEHVYLTPATNAHAIHIYVGSKL